MNEIKNLLTDYAELHTAGESKVLAELRADPRLRETRVVLFTGSPDEAVGLDAADGVLAQPFAPDQLLACVQEHLAARRVS